MLLNGNTNRIWSYWAGRFPGSVGFLISPSYYMRLPITEWMPYVLDNGAFSAWRDGKEWNCQGWRDMIMHCRRTKIDPLWAAVPDVVCNKYATISNWNVYKHEIKSLGWKMAFCVQDGMTPQDVPSDADVVFVGGSDRWKFKNLKTWTGNFQRVHCARVNAPEMIEACETAGCESIDGTGWTRDPSRKDKLPMIKRFIEGHRTHKQNLHLDIDL